MTRSKKSNKWRSQKRFDDQIMEGGLPTDIVIAVMGATGVGKSTFVNNVVGSNVMTVGHRLESCTQQIQHHIINISEGPLAGRRMVIVDTPGFDDTYLDDAEILRRIAVWLASSYHADMKLAGIVYLYDISQKRMTGSARLNLSLFQKLCGNRIFDKVLIGTTKWPSKPAIELVSRKREEELKTEYWKELTSRGTRVVRVKSSASSAQAVLKFILEAYRQEGSDKDPSFLIQRELVNQEKLVARTEAGKFLRFSLVDMLAMRKKDLAETSDEGERTRLEDEIAFINRQIGELKPSLLKRIFYRMRPAC